MSAASKLNVNAAAFIPPGANSTPSTPVAPTTGGGGSGTATPNNNSGAPSSGGGGKAYVPPHHASAPPPHPSSRGDNAPIFPPQSGSHTAGYNAQPNHHHHHGGGNFATHHGGPHHHHHHGGGGRHPNMGGPVGPQGVSNSNMGPNMHHGGGGGNFMHHNQGGSPHHHHHHHHGGGGGHHHQHISQHGISNPPQGNFGGHGGFPGMGGGHHGPHGHHPHHHHHHNPQAHAEPAKQVIIILGTPRSGKSVTATMLAQQINFKLVSAPSGNANSPDASADAADSPNSTGSATSSDKYEHLRDSLIAGKADKAVKGFVLDGYGADNDADIHYVQSELRKAKVKLDYAFYLDMPTSAIKERQHDQEADTAQMFSYAVAYETCSKYLSTVNGPFCQLSVYDDSGDNFKKTEALVSEIRRFHASQPRTPNGIIVPAFKTENWVLVDDYFEFRNLRDTLYETLGISDKTRLPARSAYNILDYGKFVRYHHQLSRCDLTVTTNGYKSIVFKINGMVYYIPEHCYSLYRMIDQGNSPFPHVGKNNSQVAIVLEVELVTAPVEDNQSGREHMIIRDVLYYEGKKGSKMPWEQRKQIIGRLAMDNSEFVLIHRTCHISEIDSMFQTWKAVENIATGIRFEHQGPYKPVNADNRIFVWTDVKDPLLSFRLWNAKEVTHNKQAAWSFSLYVVDDDSGIEMKFDDKSTVIVSDDDVTKDQLNDGHVVDCKPEITVTAVPQRARGGRGQQRGNDKTTETTITWRFHRRRNDLAFPMYKSTVEDSLAAAQNGWDRKTLERAAKAIPPPPEPK